MSIPGRGSRVRPQTRWTDVAKKGLAECEVGEDNPGRIMKIVGKAVSKIGKITKKSTYLVIHLELHFFIIILLGREEELLAIAGVLEPLLG